MTLAVRDLSASYGHFQALSGIDLTVAAGENLLVGAVKGRSGLWDVDAVHDLFPHVAALRDRPAGALSGGEQRHDHHQRHDGRHPERPGHDDGDERGEHGEVTVGEVDDPQHPEHQREPAREQRVHPAEQDPLHESIDHGAPPK